MPDADSVNVIIVGNKTDLKCRSCVDLEEAEVMLCMQASYIEIFAIVVATGMLWGFMATNEPSPRAKHEYKVCLLCHNPWQPCYIAK